MGADTPDESSFTVLITGVTGFVGRHLAEACLASGWRVRGTVRSMHPECRVPVGVEPIVIEDLGAEIRWDDVLRGVNVVVHAAAHAHVLRPVADDVAAYRRVNVEGTARLAAAVKRCGVERMVYVSSVGVLGRRTFGGTDLHASDPPRPHDDYSRSKFDGERAMTSALEGSAAAWVIVRPPLVFGPGAKGNFPRLVRLALSGVPLPFDAIHNRRSVLSVFNLADFLRLVCIHPRAISRAWLVAEAEPLSTADLLRKIATLAGRRVWLFRCPDRLLLAGATLLGRGAEMSRLLESLALDVAETKTVLNWSPTLGIDEGLRRSLVIPDGQDRIPR
jgi:nucleoside-diphosphate-sugar epimerase